MYRQARCKLRSHRKSCVPGTACDACQARARARSRRPRSVPSPTDACQGADGTQEPSRRGRPSGLAEALARAHEFKDLLDKGRVENRAALADRYGITRARVTQILDLLKLPTDVQEQIASAEPRRLPGEHAVRARMRTRGGARVLRNLIADAASRG